MANFPVRKRQGFTLVELLVTSVAASIVVLGFLSATTGYFSRDSQQRQQIAAQQALRLASTVIASDIRQAGYVYQTSALNTVAGLIPSSTVRWPANATQKLALLIPNQANAQGQSDGKFILVIYAVGPKPTTFPYSQISSIAPAPAQVIYRWSSLPGSFDPRTQLDGDQNPPASLAQTHLASPGDSTNLITYGGAATDTLPPILAGNIGENNNVALTPPDSVTLTPTGGVFGPYNSATAINLFVRAYLSASNTDNQRGVVPAQNSYLQARNLGLPPKPLPSFGGGTGGSIGGARSSCVITESC